MSSSFGPRVSQCEFLIKVFLLYDFSKELFLTFLRHQRGIPKRFLIIVVSQRQLFEDRCLLQAGFL
jgi:hypothetical protein